MTRHVSAGRALLHALLLLIVSTSVAAAQNRATDRLGWLAGCWQRATAASVVDEHWMVPRGGMMFGTARTIRRDSTVLYERMRIFDRGTALIFEARPNDVPPTEFVATDTSTRVLDFRNSSHDFPRRVVYRHVSADSLEAFIEGPMQGRTRRIDFAYRRVRCEERER